MATKLEGGKASVAGPLINEFIFAASLSIYKCPSNSPYHNDKDCLVIQYKYISYSICLWHLFRSSRRFFSFFLKPLIFHHACATYSELPSYLSTMRWCNNEIKLGKIKRHFNLSFDGGGGDWFNPGVFNLFFSLLSKKPNESYRGRGLIWPGLEIKRLSIIIH